jgi:hypothetical protein
MKKIITIIIISVILHNIMCTELENNLLDLINKNIIHIVVAKISLYDKNIIT